MACQYFQMAEHYSVWFILSLSNSYATYLYTSSFKKCAYGSWDIGQSDNIDIKKRLMELKLSSINLKREKNWKVMDFTKSKR